MDRSPDEGSETAPWLPARFEVTVGGYFGGSWALRLQDGQLRIERWTSEHSQLDSSTPPRPLPHVLTGNSSGRPWTVWRSGAGPLAMSSSTP
jgi:hypothetical protein